MTRLKGTLASLLVAGLAAGAAQGMPGGSGTSGMGAGAEAVRTSTVGVGGYDLVSYRTGEKPVRGNGNHLVVHEGVTYLFATEDNRKAFAKNPEKYLPAYGGWCAYGVSVGKKFVGDPDVWEIVDGQLYLNLDNKIKGLWLEDLQDNLRKSEANWPKIADARPQDL